MHPVSREDNQTSDLDPFNKFQKLKIALRYFLLGKNAINAVKAMSFAEQYHTGYRKDGVTPEFQHQLEIAHYARTLKIPEEYVEDLITVILLHDVTEDYDVQIDEISERFGEQVSIAVNLLDKSGHEIESYYSNIGTNVVAAIAKGSDRIHNIQSMTGVFTIEKQKKYVKETKDLVLPMVKIGRRSFPEFEPAFENIKHVLTSQIELVESTWIREL